MNQNALTVLFYLNKAKTNKNGLCPIKCRITYLKERKEFSTGIFVNSNEWHAKRQKIDQTDQKNRQKNIQLEIIKSKLQRSFLELQVSHFEFRVEDIFKTYFGESLEAEINTLEYFTKFLQKKEKLIGIDIQLATWKKFRYAKIQFASFINWKFKKRDIQLSHLKLQHAKDFEYYLKTELHQKQVTINKTIQRLRKPIREAVNEGILVKDPFAGYLPGRIKKEVVFLSTEELKVFEGHNFAQIRLGVVRDLFVFCCYTGLAYNEMSNLKKEHIVKGFDGNLWIKMNRKKTNKEISIPLLPKAIGILKKYEGLDDFLLPRYSNQKINSYLKEIADIVCVRKRITHHTARKTFASTVLLYNDVPMEIVSELLGHSSIKITRNYYGKVVQKRVGAEISRLKGKLN
ncbi:site-specific integrase [Maribacter litopenaei]|uniref:Site-specific integrase n=1 Tax=Maribacter litopenaei TaxID=2976127 RepID=A0ABY5Y7A5_9FLAO|nr:site-specific integrase [Maribacter litopenaei]UWX54910.1 site-specific integrase [Maribacter litopenaei]